MPVRINQFNNEGVVNIYERGTNDTQTDESINDKRLLQIVGDSKFGKEDLLSLRRTGFDVTKLDISTLNDLELQIKRMRQQKRFIPYWHISAHADKNYIYFNQNPLPNEWLIERLNYNEVEILFLDACESVYFADHLTGIAKHIVSVYHKIYDTDGVEIAYNFWNEIFQDVPVEKAVQNVKKLMPTISQYLWMN